MLRTVLGLLIVQFLPAGLLAGVFTYHDFSDVSELTFVNSATVSADRLRVNGFSTSSNGAVYRTSKQDVQWGFKTSYQFAVGEQKTGPGSDTLEFVVQNFGLDTSGPNMLENNLRIVVDTYQNSWDRSNWHLEAFLGRRANGYLFSTEQLPGGKNSNLHQIDIEYDAVNTQLMVSFDGTLYADMDLDLDNSLNLDDGKAWVGFHALSGVYAETHDVYTWNWESNAQSVPEPSTLILLGIGGVSMAALRRRRKVLSLSTSTRSEK